MSQRLWSVAIVASLVTLAASADPNGNKGKGGFTPVRPHGGGTVTGGSHPIGFRPVGFKPVGFKPVGFKPVGLPVHPVCIKPIGILPIGIKPVGVKPIGILPIGIKPIGIKPIGIVVKPPVKPPVVIGIVIPPKHHPWPKYPHFPHYPHYPKYPSWTYFPHCPGYGGGIVINEPYPVYAQPQAGQVILNLQCALPETANVQELTAVNVNLMQVNGATEVFGVVNDAAKQSMNVTTMANGTVDEQLVNLKMADGDELYLQSVQAENGQTYYQGSVRLLGRADNNGLVCQVTVLNQSETTQDPEQSQE